MLRSILIGLDGSPYCNSAVTVGIDWARRFDAMVVGIGIVDEPGIRRPELVPLGADSFKQQADETLLAHATRQVEQLLEQFALQCATAGVSAKVLENVGEPFEHILREAQRYDLIILGTQTHFHFATQEGPCETLKKVLKNTPRPVVAVPEKRGPGSAILIAFDGSLQAARALQLFQGMGLAGGAEVHVVTIDQDHVAAARHTDRAVEFLGFHGIKATGHALATSDNPASILLDHIDNLKAGLVVMGAYGQSAIKEFFLGSVTRTLLQESPVPLFLYH